MGRSNLVRRNVMMGYQCKDGTLQNGEDRWILGRQPATPDRR
jgi:hypothetical protein